MNTLAAWAGADTAHDSGSQAQRRERRETAARFGVSREPSFFDLATIDVDGTIVPILGETKDGMDRCN